MAWRCGSLSRALISTSRPSIQRLRPSTPPLAPRLSPRRSLCSLPKATGALGCAQSLMLLKNVVAATRLTSHIAVAARACCELSQGT